jgi:hypothetical protein
MQPRHLARLQTTARLGLAHWFFGNLYEEVVRMPARLAESPSGGPLAAGSPVLYHLPAAPVTLAATLGCVAAGWRRRLLANTPPDPLERQRLVEHWHRVNRVRLVVVAAAAVALRAGTRPLPA